MNDAAFLFLLQGIAGLVTQQLNGASHGGCSDLQPPNGILSADIRKLSPLYYSPQSNCVYTAPEVSLIRGDLCSWGEQKIVDVNLYGKKRFSLQVLSLLPIYIVGVLKNLLCLIFLVCQNVSTVLTRICEMLWDFFNAKKVCMLITVYNQHSLIIIFRKQFTQLHCMCAVFFMNVFVILWQHVLF